jgi:hypothetical protein
MASKGSDVGFIPFAILTCIGFLAIAWPYLLGTWLAVEAFGAKNPSPERTTTGWVFEVIYLVILVSIPIAMRMKSEREKADKARKEEEARRFAALKEQRKVDFGSVGAKLYEGAAARALSIRNSEAARTGWLGDDPVAYDFHADLKAIADNLRKAEQIRSVTAGTSSIRNFTESDEQMLSDARSAVDKLEKAVNRSVKLIGECAKEAASIDAALLEDRENVEMAARRDELRGRLGPILYGADGMPTEAPTEAADMVTSRVVAFHDLKAALQQFP